MALGNGCQAWRSSGTLESVGSSSRNSRGITPTTVVGRSLTRIRVPTMEAFAPNRRWNTLQARRIVGVAPGLASSSRKVRPSAGSAPSTSKKLSVTRPIRSCSGLSSPVSAAVFAQIAPNASQVVVRSRRSFSSGPESGARGYPASVMSDHTKMRRLASRYGSGASSIRWTMLKMAVFAPIPIASVSSTTAANAGAFQSVRHAYRVS